MGSKVSRRAQGKGRAVLFAGVASFVAVALLARTGAVTGNITVSFFLKVIGLAGVAFAGVA